MNNQLQSELRERLEHERERLDREIGELRDVNIKSTTYLEDETDAYDNHMADDASQIFERQKDMSLLQNLEHELDDVNVALKRMDDGTYGVCSECGKPIAEKRLQARPMATTCIECQSAIERRQRQAVAEA